MEPGGNLKCGDDVTKAAPGRVRLLRNAVFYPRMRGGSQPFSMGVRLMRLLGSHEQPDPGSRADTISLRAGAGERIENVLAR